MSSGPTDLTAEALTILIVDDQQGGGPLVETLRHDGLQFTWQRVESEEDFLASIEPPPDLILAATALPQFEARRALRALRERGLAVPFIVVADAHTEEAAVACLREGATDALLRDRPGFLGPAVRRALEEQRLRAQAREAEARYDAVSKLTSDFSYSFSVGPRGEVQVEWITGAVGTITGYSHEDLIAPSSWVRLIYAPDVEPLLRYGRALLADRSGAVRVHEGRVIARDGGLRWLRWHSRAVWDEGAGRVVLVYGAGQDITPYKRIGEHLRFQASLLDTVGQAVIASDLEGTITYWNRAAQSLYGWTAQEAVGRNVEVLVPSRLPPKESQAMLARLLSGESWTGEYWVGRRDGSTVPVLVSAVPIRDEHGAVTGIVDVSADISAGKRAEEALRASEARSHAIFQELPVPTYTWRREGDDLILTDYNRAAERITGGVVRASVGTTARAMYADHPQILADLTRCGEEQTTIERQTTYRFPTSGQVRELRVTYVFVPPDIVLAHTIDVTEQLQATAAITRHLARLSALRTVDLAITASLDLRLTLDVVLEQVITHLGVDAADVLLLLPRTHRLEYVAGRGLRTPGIRRRAVQVGEGLAGHAVLERRLIRVRDLAHPDIPVARQAEFAAEGVVTYIGVPLLAKGAVQGVLEVLHRAPLDPDEEWTEFLEMLAGQAAIAIDNASLYGDLQRSNTELALAYDTTLEGWSRALDLRDEETEGHSRRVTELTEHLAQALGMSDAELVHVRRGALLHDIGKMGIPDGILLKPGPLTEEEWAVMRQHPTLAYTLLSPIAYLRPALDIPYCHHEKWDGTGYPRGLRGEQIPLAARVFAVVDVWDALSHDRPYRAAWPAEQVQAHLRSLAGTHFDPRVLEAFLGQEPPEH